MRLMAAELASHIRDSLGPMGKRVIIVDDVGKLTITRSGIHILKSLRCSDPFSKMIVQAVDSHVTQVSKIFFRVDKNSSAFFARIEKHPLALALNGESNFC